MKILALSYHSDDTELSCHATLDKYKNQGDIVQILCLSFLNRADLRSEWKEANKEFRIDFPLPEFDFRDPDVNRLRNLLYSYNDLIKPDLVFCPSSSDCHQSHAALHNESVRVFKHTSILGYEMPWNNIKPIYYTAFSKISSDNLEAKKAAIACYKSQAHRTYCQPEYIESLARVRGQQANCEFAEQFEVIRWFL